MATLTTEQSLFLKKHKISPTNVFDATGMSIHAYGAYMRLLGLEVAIGVSPCNKAAHQLKSRSGHCVICSPAALAYQARKKKDGKVYVLHSKILNLVKIGSTGDTAERLININREGYGGATDWDIKFAKQTKNSGGAEYIAQQAVGHTSVTRSYKRSGMVVECQELFSCDVELAIKSISDAISGQKN
jgi:hypothetical protein